MANVTVDSVETDTTHVAKKGAAPSAGRRTTAADRHTPVRTVVAVQRPSPGLVLLAVTSYDERDETVRLPGEPDFDAVADELPAGCRPLAVRFELHPGEPRCTCVVSSGKGPQRVGLSIQAALALVAGGVHGIVTSGTSRDTPSLKEEDNCADAPEAQVEVLQFQVQV